MKKTTFSPVKKCSTIALVIGVLCCLNGYLATHAKSRFRLCLVTKCNIPAGTLLNSNMFELQFCQLPAGLPFVLDPMAIDGYYTIRQLTNRQPVDPQSFKPLPVLNPTLIVKMPVMIKVQYTNELKPNVFVVFLQTNSQIVNPDASIPNDGAFLIENVTQPSNKSDYTTLWIEVPASNLPYARQLTAGDWVPIIVSK